MIRKLVGWGFVLLALSTFIYSYGFVDFNLTLSSHPLVTSFVSWCQSLAMFNRPVSTQVYLGLIVSYFLLYFLIIMLVKRQLLVRFPWKMLGVVSLILTLAYPFLSSDVFKYLFSARLLLDYGLNPHTTSPDFVSGDLWLRFMRWVHTPSPYGPIMTLLAIPPYLLGFKRFTPTLYLYKLDQLAWYLLAVWLVGKLAAQFKLSKNKILAAQVFFAFNPLILLEWLVNSHNDAPMFTLLLLAAYFSFAGKKVLALVSNLLSLGVKYITLIFLPLIFVPKAKLMRYRWLLILSLLISFALAPLIYKYSFQYQPWYVTWLIPLAALTLATPIWLIVSAYTLGSLLRYLPFISTGLWSATPLQFAIYSFLPPLLMSVLILITKASRQWASPTK